MELFEKLSSLSLKIKQQGGSTNTEEATKTAFVMPFINSVLGYDVFNPVEVVPEFICDVGTKKGEKIDYAIMKDNEVKILFECKKLGEPLNINHAGQLFRYFHVTNARIAVLTNGQEYRFYTDLDAPNKMDEKPFLVLDLLEIDDYVVPELVKLTKSDFDINSIVSAAGELKYVSQIKKVISGLLSQPDDEFIKLVASRVYDGIITQKVREQFGLLTQKASNQFLNERINERLKSALNGVQPDQVEVKPESNIEDVVAVLVEVDNDGVETTEDEIEGYYIVKSIVRTVVDVRRVTLRDTKSYCGVLLDDNNRKPVCRLHFNRNQKYVGLFDNNKVETRHAIDSVDDIYGLADKIRETVSFYN